VPAADDKTKNITDLEGSVFAYSDPDSNSGYLVSQVQLKKAKIEPSDFFRKVFFTWNHRDVVIAVADGVAQGGAVDGYVWETLALIRPRLTEQTKVVWKSEKFGFPPFVSRKSLSYEDFHRFRRVLMGMEKDPEGKQLLLRLNLDGFVSGEDRLFDGIRNAMLYME
jgi:phosphonate transport system substrate-binding protein